MAFYRERDLSEFAREVTTDGVGIGGGLIIGGAAGALVESKLAAYDPFTGGYDSALQKLWGWATNNGTKALIYALAKKYDAESPLAREATKALAGSVVFDTVFRLANGGNPIPPPGASIGGWRVLGQNGDPANVQKLIQENSVLRTELNKALQKLANTPNVIPANPVQNQGYNPIPVMNQPINMGQPNVGQMAFVPNNMEQMRFVQEKRSNNIANRQTYFGSMDPNMEQMKFVQNKPSNNIANRQQYFGAMLPSNMKPGVATRQKYFGAMQGTPGMPQNSFSTMRDIPVEQMRFVQDKRSNNVANRQQYFGSMDEVNHVVQPQIQAPIQTMQPQVQPQVQMSDSERRKTFGMNIPQR